jgi:parallel beta-helix repeat protein
MIPEEGIIRVRNSFQTTISNCNISLRWSRGYVFWIDESPSNLILNNTLNFVVGEDGYHYTGIIWGDDSIVEGNAILGTGVAMRGDNLRIVDNIFRCSLEVMLANNSLIQNNTITGVSYGNPAALYLTNLEDVLIIGNSIVHNNAYGIHLYSCTNSMIYGNQIGWNSPGNAYDDLGLNNIWDNGVDTGNAWSDYSGEGEYEIEGRTGSVDRYPSRLISPEEGDLGVILIIVIAGVAVMALAGVSIILLKKRRG